MQNSLVYTSGHTYHSDVASATYEAKKQVLVSAIFSPASITVEGAKALMDDLRSNDEVRLKGAVDQLSAAMHAPADALAGQFNAITQRNKTVNSTVMPVMGRTIEIFLNQYGNELSATDTSWMNYIFTDNLQGAFKATLYDVVNNVVAYRLNHPTDPIKMSPYKAAIWENILPEYYGAGVTIERYIVEADPMSSINNIVVALRIALLKLRTEVAFERILAGITAAISAGYTTAYTASSVAKTLNAGYLALIQRCQNKGYSLTAETPVSLTGNEAHRAIVEPVMALTKNSTLQPNGTTLPLYPINRHYTFNLAADLGNSGSKVAMILPFERMRMGNFRGQMIETESVISTNSQNTYAREAYNFVIDETQIQVLTIE